MAKLIIAVRPECDGGTRWKYRIFLDGSIAKVGGVGKSVEIEVAPGPHTIKARFGIAAGSRTVEFEADPEGVAHFSVGPNWFDRSLLRFVPFWIISPLIVTFGASWLQRSMDNGRFFIFMLPALFLLFLFSVASLVHAWNYGLSLDEGPTVDLTGQRIATRPRAEPVPLRITIRGMLIIVAVLAILMWTAIEWTRSGRCRYFRIQAYIHSTFERTVRDNLEDQMLYADRFEKNGRDSIGARQATAKAGARAEYHAAMRRKYERAASDLWFTVEPDPPAPVWP